MRIRIRVLLLLALLAALFVSSAVGTLSGYTAETSFGISIRPDPGKVPQGSVTPQAQEEPGGTDGGRTEAYEAGT